MRMLMAIKVRTPQAWEAEVDCMACPEAPKLEIRDAMVRNIVVDLFIFL